jgi:hypothetical protein
MKKILVFGCLFILLQSVWGQSSFPPLDKSPMDMSYYPFNYPILKIQDKTKDPPIARVIYGRPQKDGRNIFGDLEPYGKVWRLGANEATEIEFYIDVKSGNTKIKKGRYTMYALLNAATWTIILNKDTDTWGAFKYDSAKDAARLPVPVQKQSDPIEIFTMVFEKDGDKSASLVIAWDTVLVKLPFSW